MDFEGCKHSNHGPFFTFLQLFLRFPFLCFPGVLFVWNSAFYLFSFVKLGCLRSTSVFHSLECAAYGKAQPMMGLVLISRVPSPRWASFWFPVFQAHGGLRSRFPCSKPTVGPFLVSRVPRPQWASFWFPVLQGS